MSWFTGLFTQTSSATASVDSIKKGIDEVQAQIDELRTAVASLKQAPSSTEPTEVVPAEQVGGARNRRRTMKHKRNRRAK